MENPGASHKDAAYAPCASCPPSSLNTSRSEHNDRKRPSRLRVAAASEEANLWSPRQQRFAIDVQTGALPKVTPCHVHDRRRTLITRLPDLGTESFIGHKIANHVLPSVLGHYNHNEYLAQRAAALDSWANRIEALANDDKVVQLRRSAADGLAFEFWVDCWETRSR